MGLFGKNELGVRVFSLTLTSLSLVPLYLLARDIGGRRVAFWSVLAMAAVPSYFAFGVINTPEGTQIFCWTLALFCTYRALETSRLSWWILTGVTVALGLHVKYVFVLYYPSLALCLVLSPSWRAHLRGRGLYLSVLVAFLLFAPAMIWEEAHTHWDAMRFHLSERQSPQLPTFKTFLTYQALHAGYLSPLLYLGALVAMAWSGVQGLRHKDNRLLFLFSFSAVACLFFLAITTVTQRVLHREHWDAPAYVAALVAVVMMTQTWLSTKLSERRRKGLRAYVTVALSLGALLSTLYVLEGMTGLGSRLTGSRPRFTKLLGWRRMAEEADKQFALLPNNEDAFFLGETFPCALAYAFYGHQTRRVYALDRAYNARYGVVESLRRIDASQGLARERGHNAVFVAEMLKDPRSDRHDDLLTRKQQLRQAFESLEEIAPVVVVRHGKTVKWYRVWRCINLQRKL
jgi:dolichol-phosphate mannosyltransferase